MNKRTFVTLGATASLVAATAFPVLAAATPEHVRGTIASTTADGLVVTTATGTVSVKVPAGARISGIVPGSIGDIKSGTFIGTANAPAEGAARALEVVVFPDSMRGTGEGDYPWDLPAGGSGKRSAMTNGTVAAPHGSSMTNATVSHVDSGATKTVTVSYKGGTKRIAISPGVPIVRVEPGTRALLVKGAHVFIVAASESGSLTAKFVAAGERGTVPPM